MLLSPPSSSKTNAVRTYLLTHSLTPWSRVLLEKLTGFHLVKKFPAFYGTQKFITPINWLCSNMIPFYGEELLASRPNPKLENHPLSDVRYCLFNIYAATLHIEGRSSIHNLRTRHAAVTGTHLSRTRPYSPLKCCFLHLQVGKEKQHVLPKSW